MLYVAMLYVGKVVLGKYIFSLRRKWTEVGTTRLTSPCPSSRIIPTVIRNTDWEFLDIVRSMPLWPRAVMHFLKTVLLNVATFLALWNPMNLYWAIVNASKRSSRLLRQRFYSPTRAWSPA